MYYTYVTGIYFSFGDSSWFLPLGTNFDGAGHRGEETVGTWKCCSHLESCPTPRALLEDGFGTFGIRFGMVWLWISSGFIMFIISLQVVQSFPTKSFGGGCLSGLSTFHFSLLLLLSRGRAQQDGPTSGSSQQRFGLGSLAAGGLGCLKLTEACHFPIIDSSLCILLGFSQQIFFVLLRIIMDDLETSLGESVGVQRGCRLLTTWMSLKQAYSWLRVLDVL